MTLPLLVHPGKSKKQGSLLPPHHLSEGQKFFLRLQYGPNMCLLMRQCLLLWPALTVVGRWVCCGDRPQETHQGCEHPLLCKLPSGFHGQSPCSPGGCVVQRQHSGRVCVTVRDAPTPRVSSYTLPQSQQNSSPGHWSFGSRTEFKS